jgi:hypothetical protein
MRSKDWKRAFLLKVMVLIASIYGLTLATSGLHVALRMVRGSKAALLAPPPRPEPPPATGRDQKELVAKWVTGFSALKSDLEREALLVVNKQEARIELGCSFPIASEPARRIAKGDLYSSIHAFVQAVFGRIRFNNEPVNTQERVHVQWTVDAESGRMHVRASLKRPMRDSYGVVIAIERDVALESVTSDALAIQLEDARFRSIAPLPDSSSTDVATVFRTAPASLPYIYVDVLLLREAPEAVRVNNYVQAPRALLARLGQIIDIDPVIKLALSIANIAPVLLFICIVMSSGSAPPAAIKSLSVIAAVPILLFLLPRTLSALAWPFSSSSPPSEHLDRWLSNYYVPSRMSFVLGRALWNVEFTVLGLILPFIVVTRSSVDDEPPPRRGQRLFLGLLAGLVVVIGITLVAGPARSMATWRHIVILIAASAAVALTLFLPLLWCVGSRPASRYAAIAATIFLFSWSMVDQVAFMRLNRQLIEAVLTTLCGALLLGSCALMTHRALATARLQPIKPIPERVPWTAVILCLVLAAPIARLLSLHFTIARNLNHLTHSLSFLVLWAWSVAVALALTEQAKNTLAVDELCRAGGLVVLCGALFGTQATWLFIPITFLVGWLLFDHVLVRPASDSSKIESLSKDRRGRARELIKQILDLNASERAYLAYRRKQREKFINGDIDLKAFQSGLAAVEEELETVRKATSLRGTTAKAGALGLGPEESAAGNAWHGVRWALLLATPWIIASILNVLTTPKDQSAYPLWDLIYSVSAILIRWAACGFFFGYFFSYIRGASGIQKAVWTFLVCALAQAPHAALTITSMDQARALILWNLQLFIVLMLLGLVAFDYVTLRRAGYRSFSVLFELHDVPTIGASASSILVAMGVTGATFLEGSAKQLITLALKLIIPPELTPNPGGEP